jgi:hypothetical protein
MTRAMIAAAAAQLAEIMHGRRDDQEPFQLTNQLIIY